MMAVSDSWADYLVRTRTGLPPRAATTRMTALLTAKDKLRIPELWERKAGPGKPGRACPVPYRDDSRPSGSVFRMGSSFPRFRLR